MKINDQHVTMKFIENRVKLLIGARLKDKTKMQNAVKIQDSLCEKYKSKASQWDSTLIIREFRDKRCLS